MANLHTVVQENCTASASDIGSTSNTHPAKKERTKSAYLSLVIAL